MNAFGQPRPLRALRLWELREGPGVRVLPHAARQAQAPVGQRLATGFDTRQPLPPLLPTAGVSANLFGMYCGVD